jgi:Domain of unknown function (DUF4159)/Aerotolerance regulator N-terminal
MPFLEAMSFTTPLALFGLLALPVIWWLLRFTPPKPQTVRFPPLRLLLDLIPREEQPDKTPWWLMALRLLLAALVILGISHPLLAPDAGTGLAGEPTLVVIDDSWAAAKDWDKRLTILQDLVASASRNGAPVAVATTVPSARPSDLGTTTADKAASKIAALEPKALAPDRQGLLARLKQTYAAAGSLHIVWLTDGIDPDSAKAFAEGLLGLNRGGASLDVLTPDPRALPFALSAPSIEAGRIKVGAIRASNDTASQSQIRAVAANGRTLAEAPLTFAANAGKADTQIDLPLELRNQVERVELAGERTAGAVYLLDDRWRRKTVGLLAGSSIESSQPLLSPLYYVSRALEPYSEMSEPEGEPALKDKLDGGLSMLVLADIGVLPPESEEMIANWLQRGGVLLRFAGPRLAAAQDNLVPVNLRAGGRALGSALSWETPQPLQPFSEASPFAGLALDEAIRVNRQVLAEPAADLPPKVWASLADGTPLVTAEKRGKGLVVLFHVTANADWSNLPLSGMFVEMLRRVLDLAPAAGGGAVAGQAAVESEAQAFVPRRTLNGRGELTDPAPDAEPVPAAEMDKAEASPTHPAGLYSRGSLERAINLAIPGDTLKPIGELPTAAHVRGLVPAPTVALAPLLFTAAFLLFLADCLVALWLSNSWQKLRLRATGTAILLLGVILALPLDARAEDQPTAAQDQFALANTLKTRLAYIATGDGEVDETSRAGLFGLTRILTDRTSVEPGEPIAIDLEKDEIVFFPILYWPVLPEAQAPSAAALAKLNTYIKNGGTIFFDTREDGTDLGSLSGEPSGATLALRRIVEKLDIPPIEPVPPDHVLTKAFYLLQNFPGRYDHGQLWVESADASPSSTGNADGVTSIIIGSNDYAAAWAMDESGRSLYAAIPGGDRQRELAFRAGINIVMYALTGNYKADQVHVPALLERLGQ